MEPSAVTSITIAKSFWQAAEECGFDQGEGGLERDPLLKELSLFDPRKKRDPFAGMRFKNAQPKGPLRLHISVLGDNVLIDFMEGENGKKPKLFSRSLVAYKNTPALMFTGGANPLMIGPRIELLILLEKTLRPKRLEL